MRRYRQGGFESRRSARRHLTSQIRPSVRRVLYRRPERCQSATPRCRAPLGPRRRCGRGRAGISRRFPRPIPPGSGGKAWFCRCHYGPPNPPCGDPVWWPRHGRSGGGPPPRRIYRQVAAWRGCDAILGRRQSRLFKALTPCYRSRDLTRAGGFRAPFIKERG